VDLAYSCAHVGGYFLMRALAFNEVMSAKFVFWMEELRVPEENWGQCCQHAACDPSSTDYNLKAWSPTSDCAYQIAGLPGLATKLATVRDISFGRPLVKSWGKSLSGMAMNAMLCEYNALKADGMTGFALDPQCVTDDSFLLFQPMFYQPLEYEQDTDGPTTCNTSGMLVHEISGKDETGIASFWAPRMMDGCLGVYVVARHIPAMQCLHRWFQERYHGKHRSDQHAGAHLKAALRVIGQVCYLLHGDARPCSL
jgi:hypothetical protein